MAGGGGVAAKTGSIEQGRNGRFIAPPNGAPLTDQQRAFIHEFVSNGGKVSAAEAVAGYHRGGGWRVLALPHAQAALRRRQTEVAAVGMVAAPAVMKMIAEDESAPKAARVGAAKAWFEASWRIAQDVGLVGQADGADGKPLDSLAKLERDARDTEGKLDLVRALLSRLGQPIPPGIPPGPSGPSGKIIDVSTTSPDPDTV